MSQSSTATMCLSIADNSPGGTALSTVRGFASNHPNTSIVYGVAAVKGVVHARNLSVAQAPASNFTIFVDDDEEVAPQWMAALLTTQDLTGATAVVGPVREIVPEGAPGWYQEAGFNEPERHENLSPIERGYAGNLLVSTSALTDVSGPFDLRFNGTGGEDTFLCMELLQNGAKFYWSAQAEVVTRLPLDRTPLAFVIRRQFTGAANFTRSERILYGTSAVPRRALNGAARFLAGVGTSVAFFAVGRRGRAAGSIVEAAKGLGVLAGALGLNRLPSWW